MKKEKLSTLYSYKEIDGVWSDNARKNVIDHPKYGKISPRDLRKKHAGRPCPYCGQKMVFGRRYIARSEMQARQKGYEYLDSKGNPTLNKAGSSYFPKHYTTIDHKVNKARCPEQMFDANNLEVICWKCNTEKGNNNAYEIQHRIGYVKDLLRSARERYGNG